MKKWNIALGFYQELTTVNAVVAELKRQNFYRFAIIHHKRDNTFAIHRNYHIFGRIDKDLIEQYKTRVFVDEILIIAQVNQSRVRDVLTILREVKSGHPVTFLLRPELFQERNVEIPTEPMTTEVLRQEAALLASTLQHITDYKVYSQSLITRFQKCHVILEVIRNEIADAEFIEQTVPTAAEWLLDNTHVLEASIEDVKLNLPKKFYHQLPKISFGILTGFPRIYALAIDLIKNTAGKLTRENILDFLTSYQLVDKLTIGELWAFPLMLRFRLVEWVEFLAIHIDNRMKESELASFCGNRLLYASQHEPAKLPEFLTDLSKMQAPFTGHFAEELLDHLFDEEMILPAVKKLLEEKFSSPLADILHQEHIQETTEQVIFSNCILSLITLSQLTWSEIFEAVCPVDEILRHDPDNLYSKMNYRTRNWYRDSIEDIARRTNMPEVEVAKKAIALALAGNRDFERHVGYYLIDEGRSTLEQLVSYHPTLTEAIRRWILKNRTGVYLGGIALLTLAFETFILSAFFKTDTNTFHAILFFLLSLLPISELSVQSINFLLTQFLNTPLRPKMKFEKEIPPEYKTLIVVPMMLQSQNSIKDDLKRLEIRYLANSDSQLYFGLFSDFADAPEQHMESDRDLLKYAIDGIEALQAKYGTDIFFLFHRQRLWSKSEKAWIGWERKRGKLEYLNRFLCGEQLPENIVYCGTPETLKGIRFVITLDADTQLPKAQAKALIEMLAHPLNRPYLTADCKVERGYTIIQPRVGTDFMDSKASWFCKIFSEPAIADPYTKAISNVYQDLFGEGSYHGKGIYDVQAFHTILSHHFPEEHLLSHDLIEGAFVRVGFASSICLFDTHPKNYLTWIKRQHRWMRGDWQIIDWLFSEVPTKAGKEFNPRSWINRWKIFDNLRRALLPVSLVLLLCVTWTVSPTPVLLTFFGAIALVIPFIFLFITKLLTCSLASLKSLWLEWKRLTMRSIITLAVLPFEALTSLDAMVRVAFRRMISHSHLLQWTTSEHTEKTQAEEHEKFIFQLLWLSLFASVVLTSVIIINPLAIVVALPFCVLWFLSPLIIYLIDKPIAVFIADTLSPSEQKTLRKIARKNWRYFDELVGPQTHWLPPDNYQTALNIEIAQRTSPTNIGMWLTAVLSAYDFKYITCDTLIDKSSATIGEMKNMLRHEGHFLNWYNIQTLDPLFPRYVSTVDSGNLLACFWTLKQGLLEMVSQPIIPTHPLEGIWDTCDFLHETERGNHFQPPPAEDLLSFIAAVHNSLQLLSEHQEPNHYWTRQLIDQFTEWNSILSRYFSWVDLLTSTPLDLLRKIDPLALVWRDEALKWTPSLQNLAYKTTTPALELLIKATQQEDKPHDIKVWGLRLLESLSNSQWFAGEKLGLVDKLIREIDLFSKEMNLKFLYNTDRNLFAIGYNVEDRKLDNSYYDLLASEARIASLVAIAKEDAPLDHWWSLGRLYGVVDGRNVLLSWGGTMFEYLMPLIFNKQYSDSLLGAACDAAVACQIEYGNKRGIPWGISESAYSAIDTHKIYQYKSFGIPGIGLKRGLESDLVVSPYSSALALAVNPKAAVANLIRLMEGNRINLFGSYGFYDSIDFNRQGTSKGDRGVIVHVYMAHHQGMTLATINNLLNNDALSRRFQNDPLICGVNSLLYEQVPLDPSVKITGIRKEPIHRRLEPFSQSPIMGVVKTPESVIPKVNLLSNENYSLMITNSGGGYSRWRNIDIYRWRSDTTEDSWGSFCYIKDIQSKQLWSNTYQPTKKVAKEYSVNFKADKSEFRRKDHNIETHTEVVVSPEDNAEIRMITLINHSSESRTVELTSYLELVLAPHLTDRTHPAFNKLFIETEAIIEQSALLAFRRLRSPTDQPLWALHVLSLSGTSEGLVEYETDRSKFIGRGRSLQNPAAMDGKLSESTGTVLDPIFSLRRSATIPPGQRVQFCFVTAITESRDAAILLIEKYKEISAGHRAIELSWAFAQLEMRHLHIHQEEAQLFQKLASRILYPHNQLRSPEKRQKKNRLGQPGLWAQGISGDLPIIVVTVGDTYDVDLVKQLLLGYVFLSLRGLKVDLVILDEEAVGYSQPLQEQLQNLIQTYSHRIKTETAGSIFLKNKNQIPEDELNVILATARVVLIAARGSLRQQLVSPKPRIQSQLKFPINQKFTEEYTRPLPFLELPYFNGLGGYSEDGRSYAIYLGPNINTPAPWINVLANPNFGTLVTEAGLGATWYGNSQTNRLTSWNNDPILNPISDTIYLRDEETGTVWTPTPAPIRELDAYRITHGFGYTKFEHNSHGIEQELIIFVPVNDAGGLPIRIQRLKIANHSSKKRRLSATAYSEWVLGKDHEDTQTNIITEWNSDDQILMAYNRYNSDFGNHVAFTASLSIVESYTGDRTEFIGRNRSSSSPDALTRKTLLGSSGAGLDPCSALQVQVEVDPQKEVEVVFIMGYAPNAAAARELMIQCRTAGEIERMLIETKEWWNHILSTIQIDIPDKATNFQMNGWLLYQDLCCRFWARSGFYQSSGAYGFRDQLQDVMALLYSLPGVARNYILKAASRQFVEGDVQHWWHPQTGAGIRTRCSDDLLWLPFVTAQYVRVTGDTTILDEEVSFLEGDLLAEDQEEIFQTPKVSVEKASLLEHCRRAILKGTTAGPHGLPLIGTCDWNDGMNLVGIKGKGESVWLAWFLIHVWKDFAELTPTNEFQSNAEHLADIIEKTSWDGQWYRRAYFDDGTPIGSKEELEAIIDSLTQSWAVISGAADPSRSSIALNSAIERLIKAKENLILLLTPPFDKTTHDPGYIKGYPPGVRENGGQYTHGSAWLPMAFARNGDGDKAVELLRMLSPTVHTRTPEANDLYRVEPYVLAADIYSLKNQVGRGGWTWYTGSAGWVYRIWLEEVLGFTLRGDKLSFRCAIPKEWGEFKLKYRYKSSHYDITVKNPNHLNGGQTQITLDGTLLTTPEIQLVDDNTNHTVEVIITAIARL